jgi:WASH complex subunit 7
MERGRIVGAFGLYVLYRRIVPMKQRVDEAFYRKLWAVQKKLPIVVLYGKATWFAPEFLRKHVPVPITKLEPKSVPQHRASLVKSLALNFPQRIETLQLQVATWLCRFEAVFQVALPRTGFTPKNVTEQGHMLQTGILLATKIRSELGIFVNMFIKMESSMPRKAIQPLCISIELLKSIEAMYQRKTDVIAQVLSHANYVYAQTAGETLRNLYKRIVATKTRSNGPKHDLMGATKVALNILRSGETFSFSRIVVLEVSVDVAMMKGGLKSDQADLVNRMLWNMTMLQDFQLKVRSTCDCSFLFWHRELLSPFLKLIYQDPSKATRLQPVLSAFADAAHLLNAQVHDASDDSRIAYTSFIKKQLDVEIVDKLCEGIEDVLRERVHAISLEHMSAPNPRQTNMGMYGSFLDLPMLHVLDTTVSLRRRVEHYLDRTFYNLTTHSLQDWQTYGKMRSLAVEMFGLQLTDGHLPMGSLNQGLDVLQIMRNINVFVAKYCYNLNEQLFIERKPPKGAKMANTICIHSIADSIRQHGIGIMNTTVNFTYQFLQHKFHIFSQFLLDQYINAIASRERRWFRKHRDDADVENTYPYDHAQLLIKDIRKLSTSRGKANKATSFLDKFRMLVTQIGNAVGYVRMVRSAGLNYCSNAIQFVPDLETITAFEPLAGTGRPEVPAVDGAEEPEEEAIEGAGLSPSTVAAARALDKVVDNLSTNFAGGTDYLKILAKEFAATFANAGNKHLKNFFILVTPLILNFCDSIRSAKGQLDKVQRGKPAYFTDDGFAMGVAFCLATLRQDEAFNSLHFFDSLRNRFKEEKATIDAMKATGSGVELEQRQQEIRFKQSRHRATVREVEMFFFAFDGAKIFFHGMDESK